MVEAPEGFDTTIMEKYVSCFHLMTTFRVMAHVPKVDKKVRRQVRKMLDISLSESLMNDSKMDVDETQIFTAADLEKLIQKSKGL